VDAKVPLVLQSNAPAEQVDRYAQLADAVMSELAALTDANTVRPSVSFDPYVGVAIREGTRAGTVPAAILRGTCPLETAPERVPDTIAVVSVSPKGNYAVEVVWSDRHSSIFPYKHIWDLCDED
jgi:DUF971 family protein